MSLQRDHYTPADVDKMDIKDLHAYTGIKPCKLEQIREKPVITRSSIVGGPKKLTFTMCCTSACLRECSNRDTDQCGDECLKFSNYKPAKPERKAANA